MIAKLSAISFYSTLFLGLLSTPAIAAGITLSPIGTFSTGIFDDSAAEISAYDPETQRLFVVNGANTEVDVLDLSDPTSPTLVPKGYFSSKVAIVLMASLYW